MKIMTWLAALLLATVPAPAPPSAADAGSAAPTSAAAATSPAGISLVPEAAVPAFRSAGHVPAPGWTWPLSPRPEVLRDFDPPAKPWLSGHRGVDLAAADAGAALIAPAGGTVSFVGVVVDRAVITIDHGNGLRSSFEPVASELTAGSSVAAGDVLGRVQNGHCGPAPPCVHWGVRRGEDYVNPLAFMIDLRPSVLLPPL